MDVDISRGNLAHTRSKSWGEIQSSSLTHNVNIPYIQYCCASLASLIRPFRPAFAHMSPELLSVLSPLTCSTGLSYSFIILSLRGIASGSLSVEDMLQSGGLDISFSPELSVFGLLLTHTHSLTGTGT